MVTNLDGGILRVVDHAAWLHVHYSRLVARGVQQDARLTSINEKMAARLIPRECPRPGHADLIVPCTKTVGPTTNGAAVVARLSCKRSSIPQRGLRVQMATYAQIKSWVKAKYGWSIQHDCWIARCKELAGLDPQPAWNRAQPDRAVSCPPDKQAAIISAFRYFDMLSDQ